jgi:hypothetical protein
MSKLTSEPAEADAEAVAAVNAGSNRAKQMEMMGGWEPAADAEAADEEEEVEDDGAAVVMIVSGASPVPSAAGVVSTTEEGDSAKR